MGIFKRKNHRVLDLSENYKIQKERLAGRKEEREDNSEKNSGAFGFLGDMASASGSVSETAETLEFSSVEDKRKQLSKKLLQITEKLEDLSNQIYHLQQRMEVVERKSGVGRY